MTEAAPIIDGRFVLISQSERHGGTAVVYRAVDNKTHDSVAVKIFRVGRHDERFRRELFNRELKGLVGLEDPNIVRLVDFGVNDGNGYPFVVLEWIDGDLLDYIQEHPPQGWDDLAEIALGILSGISAVHRRGHLHRDIKPENVLMDGAVPKVADFGLAKVAENLSVGVTMAGMGTQPYMPPETDDGTFSFSRDIFAFGVLLIRLLAGRTLRTLEEVESELREVIDVPAPVARFLEAAIARDPAIRPQTGEAALGILKEIERAKRARRGQRFECHLFLSRPAARSLASAFHLDEEEEAQFMVDDLKEHPVLRWDPNVDPHGNQQDEDVLVASGQVEYRIRPVRAEGRWVVVAATKLPPSVLDAQRTQGWRGNIIFRRTPPPDRGGAAREIDELLRVLAEHKTSRDADDELERERDIFRPWLAVLDAKKRVEDDRGRPLRYTSFRVDGPRVYFGVTGAPDASVVGQPRLVRTGRGQIPVAGQIEAVEESGVVLYVERGNMANLPPRGDIHYDADQSRIAIERQRQAVEAIRHGRAARADLSRILLDAEDLPAPRPAPDVEFQQDLDSSKQDAVRAALGDDGILLVEGPPGTGKTTFIAELTAQFLSRSPGGRVLITSQTHIALDNALERIRALLPDRRLVRIGRSDRISPEVDELRLEHQMEEWRDEVLRASRKFLRHRSAQFDPTTPDVDIPAVVEELRALEARLTGIRSRIVRQQAERRQLSDSLSATRQSLPDLVKDATASGPRAHADTHRGLDLESSVASLGEISNRLEAHDETLDGLRREVEVLTEERAALQRSLADALGIESGELKTETLLAKADEAAQAAPVQVKPLLELHADWAQRFGRSREFYGGLLVRADVVAATCVGLAGVRGMLDVEFDLCIVDEASKATATEAMVPMSRSHQFVLVGDRHQLPPFQEEALTASGLLERYDLSRADVEMTLFDLLADRLPSTSRFRLVEQHRMVPEIGDLVSHCFYDGELQSVPRSVAPWVLESPVLWLSTETLSNRRERRDGTSYLNSCEAEVIKRQLDVLNWTADAARADLKVALLTGYAAQRDLLERLAAQNLARWNRLDVSANTVDAFQGREADVAIVSLARSNDAGELGFLSSRQRANVSVSRAREMLLIVGDANFIRHARGANPFGDVLNYVERSDRCRLRTDV